MADIRIEIKDVLDDESVFFVSTITHWVNEGYEMKLVDDAIYRIRLYFEKSKLEQYFVKIEDYYVLYYKALIMKKSNPSDSTYYPPGGVGSNIMCCLKV